MEKNRELALKELQIKIDLFTDKKMKECRQQAFIEAETHVDSLITELLINPLSDTLYQPDIPMKPEYIPVDNSVFKSQSSVKQVIEN